MEPVKKSPSIVDWMTGSHLTSQQAIQRQLVIKYVAIAVLASSTILLTLTVTKTFVVSTFVIAVPAILVAVALYALRAKNAPPQKRPDSIPAAYLTPPVPPTFKHVLDNRPRSVPPRKLICDLSLYSQTEKKWSIVAALKENCYLKVAKEKDFDKACNLAVAVLLEVTQPLFPLPTQEAITVQMQKILGVDMDIIIDRETRAVSVLYLSRDHHKRDQLWDRIEKAQLNRGEIGLKR